MPIGTARGDDQPTAVRRLPIFLCLALILIYPLVSVPVQASISALAPKLGVFEARVVTEAAIWLYASVILAIALVWEGRTLASIGFRKFTFGTLGLALGGAAVMIGAGALASHVVYDLLHQPQHAEAQAAALAAGSVGYAVCLSIRAGVIEEVLFRGLAIN